MADAPHVPGLVMLSRPAFHDERGTFTKIWGEADLPGGFAAREVFWSHSMQGVVRGLHLQLPPHDGRKAVFVTDGEIRDFVVDLRAGSPAYGAVFERRLAPGAGALVIPAGCAHGFEVVSAEATMVYAQEAVHDPVSDAGISITSVPIVLQAPAPIISERDRGLPDLAQFATPFTYVP